MRAPLHGHVLLSGPCGISQSRLLRRSVDFVPLRRFLMVARKPPIVSGVSWYIRGRGKLPISLRYLASHSDALTDSGVWQDALQTVPSRQLRALGCEPDFDRDLRSPWHTPRHLPSSWSHNFKWRQSDQMTPRFASLPIWGMPALPHRHGVMPPCPRSVTSHLTAMWGCS